MMSAALVLLCFCGLFAGLIAAYVWKFDRQLAEENAARLAEVSHYVAAHMATVVDATQESLKAVAAAVAALDSDEARTAYLRDVTGLYQYAYMGYAGPDGRLLATEPSESRNVSREPYFRAALAGTSTVSDLTRKIFASRAASGIILAVPLRLKAGPGVLAAMLETRGLRDALPRESFGGTGRSYIIAPDGAMIMRTKSLDFANLFLAWKEERFTAGHSLEQVKADVAAGREGLVQFTNIAGLRQYAYYQPLPFNNWTLVTVVAARAVAAQTIALTRELAVLGGALVLLFMGLMYWTMRSYRISRESRMATDAKSAFLANMSHEIRTPMNAIVGISEILLRDDVTPRQQQQLTSILNSGKGLLTIIDDILDISKIEAGKFSIIEETYELESLLYDLTTVAATRIGDKPLYFLLELDPGLPRSLTGDMGRVKQVLLNLIGNAVKFTESGSVRLLVDGKRMEDHWLLRMEVRDTGIGIREEDLDKLFISFNQVDTRRNRYVKGTGLGLAISRKLCEMMGGSISVTSEYGKGSSFVLTLRQGVAGSTLMNPDIPARVSALVCEPEAEPREFASACLTRLGVRHALCATPAEFIRMLEAGGHTHALAPRAVLRGLEAKAPAGTHLVGLLSLREYALMDMDGANVYQPLFALQMPHVLNGAGASCRLSRRSGMDTAAMEPMPFVSILIVDDNEVNVQVAEGLMAPYGMRMDHVYSGPEALEAVQRQDYDMVLMDHMMPGMDGVEVTRLIRALPDAKYRELPIVALTANVTGETRQMFLENGFDGFLAKPIETTTLHRTLRSWLKDVNARRAADKTAQPAGPQAPSAPLQAEAPAPLVSAERTTDQPEPAPEETADPAPATGRKPEVDFVSGRAGMPSPAFYTRLLGIYVRSTGEILAKLPAWMDSDPERVIIDVHGLKSASASIGAMAFSDAARHLEMLGRQKNFAELRVGLPAFIAQGRQVLQEIQDFLDREAGATPEAAEVRSPSPRP